MRLNLKIKILVIVVTIINCLICSGKLSFSQPGKELSKQKNKQVIFETDVALRNVSGKNLKSDSKMENKEIDKGFDVFDWSGNQKQSQNKAESNFFKNLMSLLENFLNLNPSLSDSALLKDLNNSENLNSDNSEYLKKTNQDGFPQWDENYQWQGIKTEKIKGK